MQKLNNEAGSALVGAVAFSIILFIASLGYLQLLASTRNKEVESLRDNKAFLAAESGLELGARWVRQQQWSALTALTGTVTPLYSGISLNGMNVDVKDSIDNNGQLFVISTATDTQKLRYTKRILWEMRPHPFDTTAFGYAMLSDGNDTIRGNTDITHLDGSNWAIHCNSSICITGDAALGDTTHYIDVTSSTSITTENKKDQYINVTAPSLILADPSSVHGTQTVAAVPTVSIPDIDLTPWYREALANGAVLDGNQSNPAPPAKGNILWVNGDVTLTSGTYNCQIIATGNIDLESSPRVTAPDSGFALASQNGNITININFKDTVKGLIYVRTGNYTQLSGGQVQGQIIAKGTISKAGGSSITVGFNKTIVSAPGFNNISVKPGTWNEANIRNGT